MFSKLAAACCLGAVGLAVAMFHRHATQRDRWVTLSLQNLQALTERCVHARGYTDDEVRLIADILLYAQLRGNNQGLIKLVTGAIPVRPTEAKGPSLTTTSQVSAVIDGNGHLGMLVMQAAVEEASRRAAEFGVGVVGTVNTSSTTGALGYYAHAMAKSGLVGIVLAQSPELVCPYGSYAPFFGTNPIAFGMPAGETREPIVLDMATSAIAYYGVVEAAVAQRPIPANVAFSRRGRRTQNAQEALAGALRPFDRSYKGSGLALMVELLTGAFVGGALTGKSEAKNWGNLVLAFNPKLFQPSAGALGERTAAVLDAIKSLPARPGHSIRTPGEGSHRRYRQHVADGHIRLARAQYEALRRRATASP